ncbi:MAG: hypothetical protein U5L96_20180 [Owenweeksia sp.]|nr:hypothetical protein [Owenweeksia sp.]
MESYAVLLQDERGTPFYSYNNPDPEAISPDFMYDHSMQFAPSQDRAHAWTFKFLPKAKVFQQQSYSKGILGLIMGLLISILMGIVVYYFNRYSV